MNEQKHFQKNEAYILNLLRLECLKRKLDFVTDYGARMLFYNGDFFGLTTFDEWNKEAKLPQTINLSKIHYINEVSLYMKQGISFVIRNKDMADNAFLKKLADAECCNSLVVYITNEIGVAAYFFNAHYTDRSAMAYFINNLSLFDSIARKVDQYVLKQGVWNNITADYVNKHLFELEDRRLILGDNRVFEKLPKAIIINGKKVDFTCRQAQLLKFIKNHHSQKTTIKDISATLSLEPRTVEWHLRKLRQKVGAGNIDELKNIAEIYIN